MGREKGYTLSDERIKRMQLARKRRRLGYTRHLSVVEELARKKIEQLFEKWNLNVEDFQFEVEGCDSKFELIWELQERNIRFRDVGKKAIEYLERKNVSEVCVRYLGDEKVILEETEKTGNIIFVRKLGAEYLIESYKEWNERPGAEAENKK